MFVARDRELASLEYAYASTSFQFAVVYGRRRVGKTSILREFVRDKAHVIFFTAQESSAAVNLDLLSRLLSDSSGVLYDLSTSYPRYASFADAFEKVFSLAREERVIFVIDEYPYLAQSEKGVSSALQTLIDRHKDTSKLFLVLCGSSLSFMEHQVLGEKSPLYGRRTLQLRVKPFTIFDAQKLLPNVPDRELVELYAVAGGVPLYLSQFDQAKNTEWNIAHKVFNQSAILYEEPKNYLMQETRSPAMYTAIVEAIASGRCRPTEISDSVRLPTSAVSRYLDNLIELKIVERCTPMVKAKKRQVVYKVSDNLFRFWSFFVSRYANAIELGMGEQVAAKIVGQEFPTFVGPVFEQVCRQWLMREAARGRLGLLPRGIGSWWGTDPRTKQEEEIDIVLEGSDGELVFGECKWKNAPVGVEVAETLLRRAALFQGSCKEYFIFSKSGFTKKCAQFADRREDLRLVSLEEMLA